MRPGPVAGAVLVLSVLALTTCSESPSELDPPEATTIELSAVALEVDDGAVATLGATVLDQYGEPMPDATVAWASVDPGIASVAAGTVTGVYPGETTVEATSGDASAAATVTVVRVPTSMALVSGADQVGTVGETLADSVGVLLLDRHDEPVPGADVAFSVVIGGGEVGSGTVATGPDGTAATTWMLGTGAGEQKVEITCDRLSAVVHQVAAVALAASPDRVVTLAGDAQAGTVAEALADSVTVQVFDEYDNPVEGAVVAWEPEVAGASFHPVVSTTGGDGTARASWTLGVVAGEQSAQAVVGEVAAVVLSAYAEPGAPNELVVIRGSDQTLPVGTLADTLVVKVIDRWGNGIEEVGVEWVVTLGGGEVTAVGSASDAGGLSAAGWTLGPTTGGQVVRARAQAIPEVLFRAEAVNSPVAIYAVDGDGQDGVYGEELTTPLAVYVADAYMKPVEGARVSWQVIAGNGLVSPVSSRTDADGLAYARWTAGTAGIDSVEATVWTTKLSTHFGAEARQKAVTLELADTGFTALGDTIGMTLTGRDVNGDPLDPSTLALARVASGNPDVAQALWNGRLVSRANGEARVIAELDGVAAEAVVRVEQQAAFIEVLNEVYDGAVALRVRDRVPLELSAYDANDNPMEPGALRFMSEHPVVAKVVVGEEGPFLAADYPGRTTIRVSGGVANVLLDVDVIPGRAIDTGNAYTCALTPPGTAFCWGKGELGQLGDGSMASAAAPVAVAGGHRFRELSAGYEHACGLTLDGVLFCWGENIYGQLGDGTYTNRAEPVAVLQNVSAVAAGDYHTCALDDAGAAFCWGRGGLLGLGVDPNANIADPMPVYGDLRFTELSADRNLTCALDPTGAAFCWGFGPNGDGTEAARFAPTPVSGGLHFGDVAVGSSHACGLTEIGEVWCWGDNTLGQLGDGTLDDRLVPVAADFGSRARAVTAGGGSTCATTLAHEAYCWGYGTFGALGDTIVVGSAPSLIPVSGGHAFAWLAPQVFHSCGLTTTGAAYCWGQDDWGQLGIAGEGGMSWVPVPVLMPPGVIFARLPLEWILPGGAPPGTDGVASD